MSEPAEALASSVRALLGFVLSEHSRDEALQRVCDLAVGVAPVVDSVRLTLGDASVFSAGPVPELDGNAAVLVSLPLLIGDREVGTLEVGALTPGAFSPGDELSLHRFAEYAAVFAVNVQDYWDARAEAEQLEEAMRSRAVIEQAKGILIAGGLGGPDEAFDALASASQRQNRKVREVAAEIVNSTMGRNARR